MDIIKYNTDTSPWPEWAFLHYLHIATGFLPFFFFFCLRNTHPEVWMCPLRRYSWHWPHWTLAQTLGKGSMTLECGPAHHWAPWCRAANETSPLELMEACAALKHWEMPCQFTARSLLLKLLHNDIFIHVKIQDEFQLYDIVYVHQKCYLSLQSLVSMNRLCNGY